MRAAQGRTGMRGFTLIELMIVVVIVGVLSVVAVTAYRKYSNRAKDAEVMALFGEFRAKEEAYRTEMGSYLSTGADENTLFPVLGTCQSGSAEPCPKAVTTRPATWVTLGISPRKNQLYCGYVAIAGAAGTAPTGTEGAKILGAAAPTVPWYYLRAQCDLTPTNPSNAQWVTAMNTTVVTTANEGM